MTNSAIVIGDSFNNTLGLIRSLGEGCIEQALILVGESDRMCVTKSKYLKKNKIFCIETIEECLPILLQLNKGMHNQVLLCTNDPAATFIDEHENKLSELFITPMSGRHLGKYLNKEAQCMLAEECGFDVPRSITYSYGDIFPESIEFPLLLKPLYSTKGSKSDIHICYTRNELEQIIKTDSTCKNHIVQEFIEKEYEINIIGISTDWGILAPGGIQKIRHYPTIYSPCSFGLYRPVSDFGFDTAPLQRFMDRVGYKGPFSIELLHKADKNYFMEVNFRHDGLAYAATAAGINLPAIYLRRDKLSSDYKIKNTYMMDLSIDFCHVKDKSLSLKDWFRDLRRTGCQLNFNKKDPAPTFYYYVNKFNHKLSKR